MTDLLTPIQAALDLPPTPLTFTEAGALPSAFAEDELERIGLEAVGAILGIPLPAPASKDTPS